MLKSSLKENAFFANSENDNKLTAISIGTSAFDIFSNNINSEEFNLSPIYLKKSNAERELEEKQNGN